MLFRLVQLALLPFAVAGYVLWVTKLIAFSRRTGASSTVLASFYTRWMQHRLGTRRDEPCARLMAVLPNVSQPGLWLTTAPTLVAHRVTGHVPRSYRYPYEGMPPLGHESAARTTFFDEALRRHLPRVEQVVILGAGLDTRCFRFPARWYEIDAPRNQRFKREMLRRAGLDVSAVSYVPADFERDDWMERLADAGFDPGKPAFFLWEAVIMYLDEESARRTLRTIAGTAPGSVVAFDYLSAGLIGGNSLFMRYARVALALIREPFKFGLDPAQADAFLAGCELTLEEHHLVGRPEAVKGGFVTALI